jgi:hypothetical protein
MALLDDEEFNIEPYIQQAFDFIEESRSKGETVLGKELHILIEFLTCKVQFTVLLELQDQPLS